MRKGRVSNPPIGGDHLDGVTISSGILRRGYFKFGGGVHGGRGCNRAEELNSLIAERMVRRFA